MIAESAGLAPARCASRTAGRLMLEIGVELAPAKPRKLTAALMDQADLVVNLCEYGLPRTNTQVLKAALADPAGEALAEQRSVRNDIYAMVTRLGECLRQARQIDPVLAYSATGIQRSMTTRRSSCLNGLLT